MNANLTKIRSRSRKSAAAASTLSHWFRRFGLTPMAAPADEPFIDGATIVARKEDGRALRKEASRRAERPPLPF
jgi:hypothetical protein